MKKFALEVSVNNILLLLLLDYWKETSNGNVNGIIKRKFNISLETPSFVCYLWILNRNLIPFVRKILLKLTIREEQRKSDIKLRYYCPCHTPHLRPQSNIIITPLPFKIQEKNISFISLVLLQSYTHIKLLKTFLCLPQFLLKSSCIKMFVLRIRYNECILLDIMYRCLIHSHSFHLIFFHSLIIYLYKTYEYMCNKIIKIWMHGWLSLIKVT